MSKKQLTVVLVGPLEKQFLRIERAAIREKLPCRLRCVGSNQPQTRVPPGDCCIIMGKFVSHSRSNQVYAKFARDCVHTVHGGESIVVQTLMTLCKGRS